MITLDVLPISPNYAYRIKHNRPRYITKSKNRTRTSRVHGDDWFTFDLIFKGRPISDYETLIDFHKDKDFDENFWYTDIIIDTMSSTMRSDFVVNFDSDIDAEPPSFDDIDFNVTIEENNITPKIPSPPPKNLQTSFSVSPLKITLTWAMLGTPYSGFKIYRSLNGGAYSEVGDTGTTSFEDTSISFGNSYSYKVKAYNTNFFSRDSNIASRSI